MTPHSDGAWDRGLSRVAGSARWRRIQIFTVPRLIGIRHYAQAGSGRATEATTRPRTHTRKGIHISTASRISNLPSISNVGQSSHSFSA